MAVYRIETVITGAGGGPFYNRLHFNDPTGPSETFATSASDAVHAFWADVASGLVDELVIQVQPEIAVVDVATGQTVQVYVHSQAAVAGLNGGEALPWTTQALLQIRTGVFVAGRERRGRIFVPGYSELDNTNGRPSSAVRTALETAGNALVNFDPALAVYTPEKGVASATSVTTWTEWATLRSRRD